MIWGLIGAVIGLIVVFVMRGSRGGRGMGPGTRGWEAQLTLDPLRQTIAARKAELRMVTDEKRRDRLSREIAFLEQQVPALEALVAAKDTSPGRGYIGFDNLPAD
ncbi:MAG: hypothetical protein Q8L48_11480 [Archangium sp.]|nr:hypothetical protein [Archangium sp.]